MREPTKQMRKALRRARYIAGLGKTAYRVTFSAGMPLDSTKRIRVRDGVPVGPSTTYLNRGADWYVLTDLRQKGKSGICAADMTIGESVSYHLGCDEHGNAMAVYDESAEVVKKFYENWNRRSDQI
jgi:hypothetical protein